MKKKILDEIIEKRKKGVTTEDILKAYCIRYGIPEDVAMAIHNVIYNAGYDHGYADASNE